MGFFRSAVMIHRKIRIPKDSAYKIMNALGKLKDSIEFEDLNKNNFEAKKSYQGLINRCQDIQSKIK